jgi:hypothetical protein
MTVGQGLTVSLVGLTLALAPKPPKDFHCLNLQSQANQKLDQPFHGAVDQTNHLGELTVGKHELDEVTFDIGESMIQLGSSEVKNKPDAALGISVDRAFERLHVLHASGSSYSSENTVIAMYVIHYADNTRESFEIVYGQDVYDWWYSDDEKEPSRSKVAWKGSNDSAKASGKNIRLYHTAWKNPHPNKKVVSIDFLAAEGTTSAPFCVAITVE